MSQFHDDRLTPPSSVFSAKSDPADLPEDSRSNPISLKQPHSDSLAPRLTDADVQPMIPGLLDEPEQTPEATEGLAALDSERMSEPSIDLGRAVASRSPDTPNKIGPSHGLTGVPLRPVSAASDPDQSREAQGPPRSTNESVITEDGSSPSRRRVPTFSMPNTQDPTANRGPLVSNESNNQPVANQESNLSGTSLRPIVGDRYRVLEDQPATPQPLPGDRHVLRPIHRSKPSTNARQSTSEFSPANDTNWDGPMPGMKPKVPSAGVGLPLRGENRESAPSTFSASRDAQPASLSTTPPIAGPSADPLFVQVGTNDGPSGAPLSQANLGSGQLPVRESGQSRSTPSQSLETPRGVGRPRPRSGDYIWHVIQPDQSLESISRQYQNDVSLVPKLLELNRDLLTDPALLPVGTAIRIPVR